MREDIGAKKIKHMKLMCNAFNMILDKCLANCNEECTLEDFCNCVKNKLDGFEGAMIKKISDHDNVDADAEIVDEPKQCLNHRDFDECECNIDNYTDDDIEDIARLCDSNRKSSYDDEIVRGFRKNNDAYNEYMSERYW